MTQFYNANVGEVHLEATEKAVLQGLAKGLTAKQVALELGVTVRVVDRLVDNARRKTGSRNSTHMVAQAVSRGLL